MTAVQHPDLVRIQAIADGQDALAGEVDVHNRQEVAEAVERLLGTLADVGSVETVAAERTDPLVGEYFALLLAHPAATLRSVWQDAFTLGVLFQQRGGHTKTE